MRDGPTMLRLALYVAMGTVALAQEPVVTAFDQDGTLTWTNDNANVASCRIERAFSISGLWTNYLTGLAPTGNVMTVSVPMAGDSAYYRIVALTEPAVPDGMVLIPGGSNTGTNPLAPGESYDPTSYPQNYSLTIPSFYMDKYEVTNDKMVQVLNWAYGQGKLDMSNSNSVRNAEGDGQELLNLDASPCRITWNGSSFGMKAFKGPGYPCVEVTWYGAAAFCNYRTQMEGGGLTPCYDLSDWSCDFNAHGYRLPSEEEWEYAARGGVSSKRFPWGGDTIQHGRANYHSLSSHSYDTSLTRGLHPDWDEGVYPHTSPVGTFELGKNGYGLYDMAGNVWEWCWGSVGVYRRGRGGGWDHEANDCRVAYRSVSWAGGSYSLMGFRTYLSAGQ